MSVTRRQVLVGSGAVAAASALGLGGLLAACSSTGGSEQAAPDERSAALAGLVAIGAAYLAGDDADGNLDDVERALGLDPGSSADPVNLLGEHAAQIHADFESDDVVELDGWILSRTETRIAALAAFASGVLDD
jgi:hypothetical protein